MILTNFFSKSSLGVIDILDLFTIMFVGLVILVLIRRTEALKILLGILVVFFAAAITKFLGMTWTSFLFQRLLELLIVGSVVVFQPELRILLKRVGGIFRYEKNKQRDVVEHLEAAVFSMSEKQIGALIVIDHSQILSSRLENMVEVGAVCKRELLETIFYPLTPLHDGAVIVTKDKVAYAGAKLPLSGKLLEADPTFGTRHLAAIENAKRFDVIAIVVSEETGEVSVATKKGICRIETRKEFRRIIDLAFSGKDIFKKK